MTDTDSDMMRRQQNMDTPQTIDGEGEGEQGRGDLDSRDAKDRREALAGHYAGPGSQDGVLSQNTRGASDGAKSIASAGRRIGGLVRKGRSLLGA